MGAPELGVDVYRAVSQIDLGRGFEAGLSIVFIAVILDRITQPAYEKIIRKKIASSILVVLIIVTAIMTDCQKKQLKIRMTTAFGLKPIIKLSGLNLVQESWHKRIKLSKIIS